MFFDLRAKSFEMNYKIAPTYYTRLLGVLENVLPGDVLLNAGCGTGEFNHYLRDRFRKSFGVDINESDITTARELNIDPDIQFDVGDLLNLSFADESFDAMICVDVLEHVDQPDVALKEMRRVLRPGGQLVVTVPHKNYPFFYDPVNFVMERVRDRHLPIGIWGFGHTKLFDRERLSRLLAEADFSVVKTELLTHSFCGFLEGYIPTFLQPLFKSNAKNEQGVESKKRKEAVWRFSYRIPRLFSSILEKLIAVDRRLGRHSERGVGLLMVAVAGEALPGSCEVS